MKTVKTTAEYTILQRNDGRHSVRGKQRKWIHGDDKVAILQKEGLVKKFEPKAKPEPETAASEEGAAAEKTE